jgi:hypothetical protein
MTEYEFDFSVITLGDFLAILLAAGNPEAYMAAWLMVAVKSCKSLNAALLPLIEIEYFVAAFCEGFTQWQTTQGELRDQINKLNFLGDDQNE